ncbi:MAG: hypothetical protein ACPLSM_06950, partial [Thermosphaera sp.]
MGEGPVHVDDSLEGSLRVFWKKHFNSKGFTYLDWERLPEDVQWPLDLVEKGLKSSFKRLRENAEFLGLTVPWVNAHMVYGKGEGLRERLGVFHETLGHGEYSMKTPSEKMGCLGVTLSLLLLEDDKTLISRFLLETLLHYEICSALQEFYATEIVERSRAEGWSKSVDEHLSRVGSERVKELN